MCTKRNSVPYTIEDLDAIDPAPLDSGRTRQKCLCNHDQRSDQDTDLRRHHSGETRWANSFLSPNDAKWDLRKHASEGTEFRWALHTSQTDVDIAKSARAKCSCHSLTPEEKKPERGDLRKHHSAETDKWTLHAEVTAPKHDLRKHSSDDTRMDRDAKWTLQVPDALPNPKSRCTCSKAKRLSLSPTSAVPMEDPKKEPSKRVFQSHSLTPEVSDAAMTTKTELKKHASEDLKWGRSDKGKKQSRGNQEESDRKWELKEHVVSTEGSRKNVNTKWGSKSHLSLPVEKRETHWSRGHKSFSESIKNKSLKEKISLAAYGSIPIEPEPKLLRPSAKSAIRLISPEITITDAKWAMREDDSPLPNVRNRKGSQKHIGEITWTPYDNSPTDLHFPIDEDPASWSPFRHVTPTNCPPPEITPSDDEDKDRWRYLNQISPFPIYQGAWKDESPSKTPILKATTPIELTPPVWSPQQSSPDQKPPLTKTAEVRTSSRKHVVHAKSEDSQIACDTSVPATLCNLSEKPRNRQRPQLQRSKALLEVPAVNPTKRSLSEEVPRYRMNETTRGPNRTRSEEGPKYGNPWFANSLASESTELCQYVTTV